MAPAVESLFHAARQAQGGLPMPPTAGQVAQLPQPHAAAPAAPLPAAPLPAAPAPMAPDMADYWSQLARQGAGGRGVPAAVEVTRAAPAPAAEEPAPHPPAPEPTPLPSPTSPPPSPPAAAAPAAGAGGAPEASYWASMAAEADATTAPREEAGGEAAEKPRKRAVGKAPGGLVPTQMLMRRARRKGDK